MDVIVSNCVLNLSGDKPKVLAEAARVLKPGGRFAVSDVIASPDMDEATRADLAAYTGCIAGALTEEQFRDGLTAAGFTDIEIRETHRVHEHATSAIVRARKPGTPLPASTSDAKPESPHAMSTLNVINVTPEIPAVARRIEMFEPAMCCQSGVCGPSVDQQLIDIREDLRWAQTVGAQVSRHNLSSDPDAFVANPKVTGLMAAFGEKALPVLLLDGDIAIHGRYPSREELADAARHARSSRCRVAAELRPLRTWRVLLMSLHPAEALPALDWTGWDTRYLFFTGKGGVGKTTTASAVAVALADAGKRTLVISTDPASNLDDVFGIHAGPQPTAVPDVPGLFVVKPRPRGRRRSVQRARRRPIPRRAAAVRDREHGRAALRRVHRRDRRVQRVHRGSGRAAEHRRV